MQFRLQTVLMQISRISQQDCCCHWTGPVSYTHLDVYKRQVYYRVHVSNIGWLDWTADGAPAGTKHYKYPIEAIQVEVIPDDADNVPEMGKAYKEKSDNVRYSVSVSDAGWQEYSANGEIAGTTGKNKAIKALTVEKDIPDLNVEYTSYNKENDWQDWVNMGEETGNDKALEAIKIKPVSYTHL